MWDRDDRHPSAFADITAVEGHPLARWRKSALVSNVRPNGMCSSACTKASQMELNERLRASRGCRFWPAATTATGANRLDLHVADYDGGGQILSYHDPSTEVFFLAAGRARVIIYSAEARPWCSRTCGPGNVRRDRRNRSRPRSASVEAIEPCTVASLTAAKFEGLLLRQPAVALATLRHMTEEVRRLSERVLEFSTLVVRNRIHAELLRLAADAGQRDGQSLLSPALRCPTLQPRQHAS